MYNDPSTLKQIAEIQGMSVPELKTAWMEHFDFPPPNSHKAFLSRRLIHKVQIDRYGDIPSADKRLLDKLAADKDFLAKKKTGVLSSATALPVGTKLVREFRGVVHTVTVTQTGFEFGGQPYKSLSAIAFKITGTKWSGNAFFGLKRRKKT